MAEHYEVDVVEDDAEGWIVRVNGKAFGPIMGDETEAIGIADWLRDTLPDLAEWIKTEDGRVED